MMVGDEDVGTEPKQENNANDGAIHGMDEKNDNNDGQAQPLANNGTHEDIVRYDQKKNNYTFVCIIYLLSNINMT